MTNSLKAADRSPAQNKQNHASLLSLDSIHSKHMIEDIRPIDTFMKANGTLL